MRDGHADVGLVHHAVCHSCESTPDDVPVREGTVDCCHVHVQEEVLLLLLFASAPQYKWWPTILYVYLLLET